MKSEGHLRAMRVFAENPGRALSEFSGLFLKGFLDTLSHRHGSKRVLANTVYQECVSIFSYFTPLIDSLRHSRYIADKDHIHMNATAWSSLGGLCRFLGREGKAVVDETEKGWYISYIDKDPNKIARQALLEGRQQAEQDEEERIRRLIDKQIAAAGGAGGDDMEEQDVEDGSRELRREGGEEGVCLPCPPAPQYMALRSVEAQCNVTDYLTEKIQVNLSAGPSRRVRTVDVFASSSSAPLPDGPSQSSSANPAPTSVPQSAAPASTCAPMSSMERLMQEEERRKSQQLQALDKQERKDYWLHTGIAVKILNKRVGDGQYYKEKGVVEKVIDRYVGEVRLADGVRLRLDQQDLETVIPKVGSRSCVDVEGLVDLCFF